MKNLITISARRGVGTFILASLVLILIYPSVSPAYDWSLFNPDSMDVQQYHNGEAGTILDYYGTPNGLVYHDGTGYHFATNAGLPVVEMFSIGYDSVLVLMNDGSWSDGIYLFEADSANFTVMEWAPWPEFIYRYNDMLYVGFNQGLLQSADGISWDIVPFFEGMNCVAMAAVDNHAYVAVLGAIYGVFTSHDSGLTWNQAPNGCPPVSSLAIDYSLDHLYAVVPGISDSAGLWRSIDQGDTWEPVWYQDMMNTVYNAYGMIFVAYDGTTPASCGVSAWDNVFDEMISLNDGLGCLRVNNLSDNNLIDCPNVVASTDSGAYMLCGFDEIHAPEPPALPRSCFVSVYPNPFNNTAGITITLPQAGLLEARVYDLLGREVAVLLDNQPIATGTHRFTFNGHGLASGIYLLQVKGENSESQTRKLILLR